MKITRDLREAWTSTNRRRLNRRHIRDVARKLKFYLYLIIFLFIIFNWQIDYTH